MSEIPKIQETIDRYGSLVVSVDEDGESTTPYVEDEKGNKVRLQIPPGELNEAELTDIIEAISHDNEAQSIEETMVHDQAALHRKKLRLRAGESRLSPQEVADQEKQISYALSLRKYMAMVVPRYLSKYKNFVRLKKKYATSLAVHPDRDLESKSAEHFSSVMTIVDQQVKFSNYRLAIVKENAGEDIDVEDARKKLGSIHFLGNEFDFHSVEPKFGDPALEQKSLQLMQMMNMLLAGKNTNLPGIIESGVMPIDMATYDLLNRALDAARKKETSLRRADNKDEYEIKRVVDIRREIESDMMEWGRSAGSHHIDALQELDVHEAFGRRYDDKPSEPFTFPVRLRGGDMKENPDVLVEPMNKAVAEKVGRFRGHIQLLLGNHEDPQDKGLFTIGDKEQDEDEWNKEGRITALKRVRQIAKIIGHGRELIGKLPMVPDKTAEEYTDEVSAQMTESLGLPEGFDPNDPDAWKNLTQEQFEAVEKKMKSTADVLRKYEPQVRENLERFDEGLETLTVLRGLKHPDELIGVEPDFSRLPKGRITPESVAALKDDDAAMAAAHIRVFEQMRTDWDTHMDTMHSFTGELDDVLGTHIELSEPQGDSGFPYAIVAAIIGAAALTYITYKAWQGGAFKRRNSESNQDSDVRRRLDELERILQEQDPDANPTGSAPTEGSQLDGKANPAATLQASAENDADVEAKGGDVRGTDTNPDTDVNAKTNIKRK